MKAYVVDENVAIVANDNVRQSPRAPQADTACRIACIQMLKRAVHSGLVIIDDEGKVLENYRRYLNHRGQPGVGDAFFKHVSDFQFNRRKVRRTRLVNDTQNEFEAFPKDDDLATFDPSDRIYVALALTAPERPTILNAVDSDYSEHKDALERNGVEVVELCAHCIRES